MVQYIYKPVRGYIYTVHMDELGTWYGYDIVTEYIPGDSGCGSEAKGQFSCRGCKGSNLLASLSLAKIFNPKEFRNNIIAVCDQSLSYKPNTS